MAKLIALLAALVVTALCVVVALYAMKLSMLVLMHWQALVALSLLVYVPMLVVMVRRKRQASRVK
jgi:hypothetical protein